MFALEELGEGGGVVCAISSYNFNSFSDKAHVCEFSYPFSNSKLHKNLTSVRMVKIYDNVVIRKGMYEPCFHPGAHFSKVPISYLVINVSQQKSILLPLNTKF